MMAYKSDSFIHRTALLRGYLFKFRSGFTNNRIVIGPAFFLFHRLGIVGPGWVEIGKNCQIDGVLGDSHRYVTLYTHSKDSVIKIGDRVKLYGTRISSRFSISIGDDVLIEHAGIADTDFHSIDRHRKPPESESNERCRIVIGDRAAIGSGSIIMKGVEIGHDTIITQGSVVPNSIPPMCIASGNPAKIIHRFPDCNL